MSIPFSLTEICGEVPDDVEHAGLVGVCDTSSQHLGARRPTAVSHVKAPRPAHLPLRQQGLRGAWGAHLRQACSLSRALATVLSASSKLLSSPESAPISRGAAGPLAAGLLQSLVVLQPEVYYTVPVLCFFFLPGIRRAYDVFRVGRKRERELQCAACVVGFGYWPCCRLVPAAVHAPGVDRDAMTVLSPSASWSILGQYERNIQQP